MDFRQIVDLIQSKSKQALDSYLVGNHTSANETLEEIAKIIIGRHSGAGEVAADSPKEAGQPRKPAKMTYAEIIIEVKRLINEADIASFAGQSPSTWIHLQSLTDFLVENIGTSNESQEHASREEEEADSRREELQDAKDKKAG